MSRALPLLRRPREARVSCIEGRALLRRTDSDMSDASNHYLVEVEEAKGLLAPIKAEIDRRFRKSPINAGYVFPRSVEKPQLRSIDFRRTVLTPANDTPKPSRFVRRQLLKPASNSPQARGVRNRKPVDPISTEPSPPRFRLSHSPLVHTSRQPCQDSPLTRYTPSHTRLLSLQRRG